MSEHIGFSAETAGMPPGAPVYVGAHRDQHAVVRCYTFGAGGVSARQVDCAHDDLQALVRGTEGIHWIDLCGLSDVPAVQKVSAVLGLHPLAVEDILNTQQRPKIEGTDDYVYFVLKAPDYAPEDHHIYQEQIAVALGRNIVLSFQEYEPDLFQPIIDRVNRAGVPRREATADLLAYSLMDAVVDRYFTVLEEAGDRLETIEEQILSDHGTEAVQAIHSLKRELLLLRRAVWPLREVIGTVLRDESPFFQPSTRVYTRDLYDHTIQVMDTLDTYRDMLSSLFDIHLSSISNRMNEIMKVLTIFSTIFAPLTFIAGVYGMNFRYMPALSWRWGYPLVWVVMVAIAVTMAIYFRRRRWL